MVSAAGVGGLLAWQNRDAVVQVHVDQFVWSVRLYGLLILGALLACWFLLGAAFIQCRIAERRRAKSAPTRQAEPARVPLGARTNLGGV